MKLMVFTTMLVVAIAVLGRSQSSAPSDQPQMHAKYSEQQMMAEHVADLKATSQALATNLAQLKATLPLINDLNERSRWQANIAMWQALADHFSHMLQHAEHMQKMEMGCGTMTDYGAGEHRNHEHTQPATPAKPQ